MTWVRLDDKFPSHPKVSQLTDREFRVHIRVLCYCAEYDTRGELEAGVWNEIPGLTKPIGRKFVALGIWDEDGSGRLTVHEFEQFNARSLEERVEAYLRAHPEASANEVHRTVGGTRQVVLDLVQSVRRRFDNGSDPGTGGGSTVPPKPVRPVVPKVVPAPSPTNAPNKGRSVDLGAVAKGTTENATASPEQLLEYENILRVVP